MTQTVRVALGGGQNEGVDPRIAPAGTIRLIENLRPRKDGRLGLRGGYTALGATTHDSGALVAYDLCEHYGRLIAFGDTNSVGQPMDLFEYIAEDIADWRGTDQGNSQLRLNPVTGCRQVGGVPHSDGGIGSYHSAAAGGLVCQVYSTVDEPTATFVHVVKADTDQTVYTEKVSALAAAQVVAVTGSIFMIVGYDTSDNSYPCFVFDPATDTALDSVGDAVAGAASEGTAFAMAPVTGSAEAVVFIDRGTGTAASVVRIDTTGTVNQTITLGGTNTVFAAIESDGTTINAVLVDSADDIARLYTWAVAGGALADGPTALSGSTTTIRAPAIARYSATHVVCALQSIEDDDADICGSVHLDVRVVSGHAQSDSFQWFEGELNSRLAILTIAAGQVLVMWGGAVGSSAFGTNALCGWLAGTGGSDVVQVLTTRDQLIAQNITSPVGLSFDASTSLLYWGTVASDNDLAPIPLCTEVRIGLTERRQTASFQGLLYVAGGALQAYDGRLLVESGFHDLPEVRSSAGSNGAGALENDGVYQYTIVWEWSDSRGNLHQSNVSPTHTLTLGASDDTATLQISTPHSLRVSLGAAAFGTDVVAAVFRTEAGGSIFRRVGSVSIPSGTGSYGNVVEFIDLVSDATQNEGRIVYTEGETGAQSGRLPSEAPLACKYVWANRDSLTVAGLTDPSMFQISKPTFFAEPVNFANQVFFWGRVTGTISAIGSLDERKIFFTEEGEIFEVFGDAPDDVGNGSLPPPQRLPSDVGCKDWRSVVECSLGLIFQADSDKLYLLPRGGGSPLSIADGAEDVLAAFPVVTSARVCIDDMLVTFTLQNAAGSAGRVLHLDLRTTSLAEGRFSWFVDRIASDAPVLAAAEYDDRLCLLTSSGVLQQSAAAYSDAGAFIGATIELGTIYPVGPGGHGQLVSVQAIGEYRDNCVLGCEVSYDDGGAYTAQTSYDLDTLTAGATESRQWYPARRKGEGFRVRLTTTEHDSDGPSEAYAFNQIALEFQTVQGTSRRPSGARA